MENTKISIIIPTFNRAKSLSTAIESVLAQTNKMWELIIVDDGSTDSTSNLLKSYQDDNRIKAYYQTNQGVSAARNYGVQNATGSHLIFLDSDDQFYPDLIQTLYNENIENYDLICWQVKKIIDGKERLWEARKLGGMYNFWKVTFFPGSVCYKKEIFWNAGGFDPKIKFGENYELGIRISDQPQIRIKLIPRVFYLYVIRNSERESNTYEKRLPSHFYQLRKHLNKYNHYPREKAELLYIIAYLLEKKGFPFRALILYKIAYNTYPYRIKTILKILYLSILK